MARDVPLAHLAAQPGGRLPVWEQELYALKRKIYTAYLALGAIAIALILVFPVADLEPGAQQILNYVIPAWIVVATAAIVAMHRRLRSVVFVERMLYFAAYPLYVGSGAALMVTGDDPARQLEYFHATAQWIPVAYIWAYLAFGTRRGLLASVALLATFVITIDLAATHGPHGEALAGALPATIIFLATSTVLILALFVLWTFVERQTRGRAAVETLARYATVDSLTGLPNRRALDERLEHDLAVARRNGQALAAYFIDLDDLKAVNDTYGHQGGDELITRFAERLWSSVRAADLVARISGDEFVVAGFVRGADDAAALAKKLLDATAEPFTIAGDHVVKVGASIGVSLFPDDALDAPDLLRQADVAMYAAKLSGKNRWRMASTSGANQPATLQNRAGDGAETDEVRRS